LFAPGSSWGYCNTNYLLAGMIAESVTGLSYGKLLHDSILIPLQMDSTFLDVYDSVLFTVAHPWQAGVNNISTPRKSVNSAAWSAGAMYSTSGEMAQWYQALMNGQVINSTSINEMTTFVGSGNYGIGISEAVVLGRTIWTHGGTIWGGYNSSMMYDTTTGVIICVLINQLPAQAFQLSIQLLSNIISNSLGTSQISTSESLYKVYPNPANDFVQINILPNELKSISIFNASGELINNYFQTKFSVSHLSPGIYFIKVNSYEGTFSYKLIKTY
jgi:CubicO group peptidase (beta-lactamase class C family)